MDSGFTVSWGAPGLGEDSVNHSRHDADSAEKEGYI